MRPQSVEPFGESALLVSLNPEEVMAAVTSLQRRWPQARVRPGIASALLEAEHPPQPDEVLEVLVHVHAEAPPESREPIEIGVAYDGEDLPEIAAASGMAIDEVIEEHIATTWRVAMLGFAPGFPYLVPVGTPPRMAQVPRLATPRTRVPAGSVAVAAGMSCVYPSALPGGWLLLGRTDAVLFDPGNPDRPSLLVPGDLVHVTRVR